MDAGVLLQVLLAGAAQGATLGLVALGFSVIAATARVVPFAHGDITVGSIFLAVLAVIGRTPTAAPLAAMPSLLLALLTLVAGGALSGMVAGLIVLPALGKHNVDRAGAFGWIAGGLAAGLLVRAVLGFYLPQQAYAVPDALRLDALLPAAFRLPGGTTIEWRPLAVVAIGLTISLSAQRLLIGSRFGRSLRAVADDPVQAMLCGVSARRLVLGAFIVAGLLAGVAALLATPGQALSVDNGALLGLAAAVAAIIGGLGSLPGAIAGGLTVGVIQALAGYVFGSGFYDLVPLVLLVVVLAVRPPGVRSLDRR